MARDSTLDEFVGDRDGDTDAAGNGADPDDLDETDPDDSDETDPDDSDEADPATPTCEWTPDGAACEACGAAVERRWTDGDGRARVCADCKDW